ncbi:MAG: cysteine hydrolase [Coprobacillus sp.]|nr:cysteine hydrolase [Coprobacillus sp.]
MKEEKYAVIVIDMLEDFFYGALKFDRSTAIVPNVKKLVLKAREKNVPVIFACDSHLKGIDKEFELWGEHAVKDSEGAKIIKDLDYNPDKDYVIYKRRYSAFFRTDLDILLNELGVNSLIFVGVHTHICVQHTVADAYYLGYKIIVLNDGTTAFTQENHDQAIKFMSSMYGADIINTDQILKKL